MFCTLFTAAAPCRGGRRRCRRTPEDEPSVTFFIRRAAPRARRWLCGAVLAAAALAGAPARAQQNPPPSSPPVPQTPVRDRDRDEARDRQNDALAQGPLLDAPVSRTAYTLGAGDVVNVAVFGTVGEVFTVPVSPEGALVVPGMGSVRVLGLNLDQAEARVQALVSRYYLDTDVAVTLARVRTFKVYVVGNVPEPGMRVASAATRVSEVVPPATGEDVPQRRNVVVRRASGDSVVADLARFAQTGDVSANPALREGDAVVVPTVDETVTVVGRVRFPARYEFRRGETLAELLALANGGAGFPANAADTVRVSRFVGDQERQVLPFTQEQAMGAAGRAFVLQPFDAVFVAEMANYRRQKYARVEGQVRRPGMYPIRPDTTTVRDLVAMAGGLTPEASPGRATLHRAPPDRVRRGEAEAVASLPPELLTEQDRRILAARASSDPTVVAVNLEHILSGDTAQDQRLRSGDVLTIPERRDEVTVLGAVLQPGIVDYVAGQRPDAFIARAGWYSRRADWDRVVVIRARTGAQVSAREVREVEPGDNIVVPFRADRDWTQYLQLAAALASTVTGITLAIIEVF